MPGSNSDKVIQIIDDEDSILSMVERYLKRNGFEVRTDIDAETGLDYLREKQVDLILVDLKMPGMDGLEFVKAVKDMKYPAEIVVMSGYGTVETAVEAIKIGAFDFIEKPLNFEKLMVTVQNALQKSQLKGRIAFLESRIKGYVEFEGIIGGSGPFLETKKLAEQISRTDVNLMISGESGTGKEVFARAIHNAGPRGDGPFVAINCGAISENLLESELFGHEKGAFSGAVSRRIGHFEYADGGTIFLDEVSELPLSLQVKLLRMVQEKEIMRVGSSRPIRVDCRIVSATNRDIEKEVAEGRFREDLYYRLNVIELKIPTLRERIDDVPLLMSHFLKKHSDTETKVDMAVVDAFQSYHWPGNVRELENIIQRAVALMSEHHITVDLLPKKILNANGDKVAQANSAVGSFKVAQDTIKSAFEKDFVVETLRKNKGNVLRSSEEMGLTRQTLHKIMKKHGISGRDFKEECSGINPA
jgi:DNA-binding NtrC family response regulator